MNESCGIGGCNKNDYQSYFWISLLVITKQGLTKIVVRYGWKLQAIIRN
jgi:hypothetical protein